MPETSLRSSTSPWEGGRATGRFLVSSEGLTFADHFTFAFAQTVRAGARTRFGDAPCHRSSGGNNAKRTPAAWRRRQSRLVLARRRQMESSRAALEE